jgi:hypothetical protein
MRWFNSKRHINPSNIKNEKQKSNWWAKQLSSFEDWNKHELIEGNDTNVNKSNDKKIQKVELKIFETENWMKYIEKYKRKLLGERKFYYNNVPTYNEGEALNELEGTMPGIDIDDKNRFK